MKHIHLIPHLFRNDLIKQQTKTSPFLLNHHVSSLNQAFIKTDSKRKLQRTLQAFKLLKEKKEEFSFLKDVLVFIQTIEQVVTFLDECDQYHVDVQQLHSSDVVDLEKIKIIQYLDQNLTYRPYQTIHSIQHQYHLYPQYVSYFEKENLTKQLELPKVNHQPIFIEAYQALNPRQEVESIAQWIVLNQPQDLLLLVGNLSSYQHEIERIFTRYGLSFSMSKSYTPLLFSAYYHLAMYAISKQHHHLIHFLSLNPFHLENNDVLVEYLKLLNRDLFESFDIVDVESIAILDKFTQSKLLSMQETAKQVKNALLDQLHLDFFDTNQILISCFDSLQSIGSANEIRALKQRIEVCRNYLHEDYETVLQYVCLQLPLSDSVSGDILIGTYQDLPYRSFENLILCGLTTQSFPQFNAKKGLFSEAFVQRVKGYPTLEKRVELHQLQLNQLFASSDRLIYSFPMMDYSGSAFEKPLEIESQLATHQIPLKKWEILEASPLMPKIVNIDPQLASQLFFDDNQQLRGSISSFETYFKNSYQYFIERGLRLRKPQTIQIDLALMGTITHYVMEQLVKANPKHYPQSSIMQIESLLQTYHSSLAPYFSERPQLLSLYLQRSAQQIFIKLQQMKAFEEANPLEAKHFEYTFHNYQELLNSHDIIINGIIDRIDVGQSTMMIIDYKSSKQELKEKEVVNGKKLQLLTYGFIASELLNIPLLGVYYIDMSVSIPKIKLARYLISKGIQYDYDLTKPFYETISLEGMTFRMEHDHPLLEFIQGVSFSKTSGKMKKIANLNITKEHLQTIYKHLVEGLKSGSIQRYNDPDKSKYFEMKDLGRYKRNFFSKTTLMEYEDIDEESFTLFDN